MYSVKERHMEDRALYYSGKLIEWVRIKRHIESQSELARMANVDAAALNRWENGKRLPGDGMIRRIAKTLGIETEDILSLTDSERNLERVHRHFRRAQNTVLDEESVRGILTKYGVRINAHNAAFRGLPCVREGHPIYAGAVSLLCSVPLVGEVPSSALKEGVDADAELINVDEDMVTDVDSCIALVVKGDRLTGYGVEQGYVVVVDKVARWRPGDIVLVRTEQEYNLKRLTATRGNLMLQGLGPEEIDYVYSEETSSIEILGVVVHKRRRP